MNTKVNQGETIFSVMSAYARKYDAINLGQGFPDFDCSQELKDIISKYLQDGKNQYCPMPGHMGLRESISDKIFSLYNYKVNPDTEITITAGATQAIYTAISSLITSGDEVIIIEPAYDCYAPSIRQIGGIVVSYMLKAPKFNIDWDEIKKLVTNRTQLIIINTPHNPIGKILKRHDLLELEKIVQDHNLYVISDEVYEHLIYDKEEHQSVLKFPELFSRSMAIYSFGKTFHATGWKIGYCVAPEPLMKKFRKVHQWVVFSVNSFIQYALADYLKEPNTYLELSSFYQQKRDYFNELMTESALIPLKSEGSYFQLFDYSKISDKDDLTFAKWMCREKGVASIPLSPFYQRSTDDKLIRLCFAKTENVLKNAAEKLCQL